MAESMNNLEDIMMGNVSEEASESDEKIKARAAAVQAKIQKIKKDEGKAKNFDEQLAKLIKNLSADQLDIVISLINHELPSLTILAVLSLVNDEAGKICFLEFEKYIQSRANFSHANLPEKIEEKISYWWTFIYGADHVSATTKLKELRGNSDFVHQFSHYLGKILHQFLRDKNLENFDKTMLQKILKNYEMGLFGENKE